MAYGAGQFAIEWGIVPWSQKELLDAVVTTYAAARSVVCSAEGREKSTDDIIAKISVHLRDRSRICDLRKTARHKGGLAVEDADAFIKDAFIKEDEHGVYYAVKKAALARWVGKHVDLTSLGEQLLERGYLITEKRSSRVTEKRSSRVLTKQVQIPGIAGRRRYYCISRQLVLDGRRSSRRSASPTRNRK